MAGNKPDFDSIKQTNVYGEEYWSARDLMPLLGYSKWERFAGAIKRAMTACQESGNIVENHFPSAGKMVSIGSGAQRLQEDYNLSRFACYLIAQNGDPRKKAIAEAQVYFAISTRANEIHQLRKEQEERLAMRLKVSDSYKALFEAAANAGVQSEFFGIFTDAGYLGLHRHTMEELKVIKDIPEDEDYLDNIQRSELSAIDFKNTQTPEDHPHWSRGCRYQRAGLVPWSIQNTASASVRGSLTEYGSHGSLAHGTTSCADTTLSL